MTKAVHRIYISTMVIIIIVITAYLSYFGVSFYSLPVEERFYHPQYDWFKPSGLFGQGLGIIGTFMVAFGVAIYIARKKHGFLDKFIRIKYLLEFHIFLCTLGPILVLFHTSFKFGGIVSIAFWSMVAVVASGVVGRFIYVQIPRNIKGQELGLDQIQTRQSEMLSELNEKKIFSQDELDKLTDLELTSVERLKLAKKFMNANGAERKDKKQVLLILKDERQLQAKIKNLNKMKTLFKYWHVIHKPFALIMLIIVIVHVIVTITLGYKWIF